MERAAREAQKATEAASYAIEIRQKVELKLKDLEIYPKSKKLQQLVTAVQNSAETALKYASTANNAINTATSAIANKNKALKEAFQRKVNNDTQNESDVKPSPKL